MVSWFGSKLWQIQALMLVFAPVLSPTLSLILFTSSNLTEQGLLQIPPLLWNFRLWSRPQWPQLPMILLTLKSMNFYFLLCKVRELNFRFFSRKLLAHLFRNSTTILTSAKMLLSIYYLFLHDLICKCLKPSNKVI